MVGYHSIPPLSLCIHLHMTRKSYQHNPLYRYTETRLTGSSSVLFLNSYQTRHSNQLCHTGYRYIPCDSHMTGILYPLTR